MPDLPYHAWTHRPKAQGGTDPIDVEAGTDTSYSLLFPLMGPDTIDMEKDGWADFTQAGTTYDPTKYGTWKVENITPFSGGVHENGATWTRGARLGPKGSVWAINVVSDLGPDCGRLSWEIASDTENDPTPAGPTVPDGYLYTSPNTEPSFVSLSVFSGLGNLDLYSGGATIAYSSRLCELRIMGDPGDPLTTNSGFVSDGFTNVQQLDGGPGIYWIRMTVDGKNASSSAFRCGIRGYWIGRRSTPSGFST